jgi:hypothetical protein
MPAKSAAPRSSRRRQAGHDESAAKQRQIVVVHDRRDHRQLWKQHQHAGEHRMLRRAVEIPHADGEQQHEGGGRQRRVGQP